MNAEPRDRRPLADALSASVLPAVATLVVMSPLLLGTTGGSLPLTILGLVVLPLAAPAVAYLMQRHHTARRDRTHSLLVGLPQLPLVVALAALAVWLEVRRGAVLPGRARRRCPTASG